MAASEPPERFYLEKQQIPIDEDDFKYEEVSVDEDFLTDDIEEDLEKAVRTVRDSIEDGNLTQRTAKSKANVIQKPEVVDDFIRNFLLRVGLHRTLDCFQSEWYELLQKGLLSDTDAALPLPDAYAQNQLLDQEVRLLRKEVQRYRETALKAKEAYVKVRKERDFHRTHHKRVVQEKNTLVASVKRLKALNASFEPTMKQMQDKYDAAMKEKTMLRLERDKVSGQLDLLRQSTSLVGSAKSNKQLPAASDAAVRNSTQKNLAIARNKYNTRQSMELESGHPDDSVFPADGEINPKLAYAKGPPAHLTRTGGFRQTAAFNAHSMAISSAALHPRKQILATASDDQTWKIWAIPSGEIIMTGEGHTDFVSDCAFHPSGTKLATVSGDTTVKIWDLSKTACVHTFMDHPQPVWSCSWHSCGNFLATSSQDSTCKVWDLNSLRCRQTLRGHSDVVNSVEFLPFSNTLVTSSADKTVILWDARTGLSAESFIGHSYAVNCATLSARGDKLASCDSFGVVRVWDLRTAVPLATVNCGPHAANRVAFDPSGGLVAIASSDKSVRMWEVNNGAISSLTGHADSVNNAIFSHAGENLISVGSDCTVRIWS